jgi:hypothetical protein
LLHTLEVQFHITGKALSAISSYLSDRTFQVNVGHSSSSVYSLPYGVPQGSILGPLLFTVYTASLSSVLSSFGLSFHFYADDTQLWIEVDIDDPVDISSKTEILEKAFLLITDWMSQHKLQLNAQKTEFILISPISRRKSVPTLILNLNGSFISPSNHVRNLGFIFDKHLTFDQQISSVIKSCYFYLRNIASVKKYLPPASLETLVHAFISSRLDFCNILYSSLSAKSIYRLQKIQNSAAKLINNAKKSDHVTPLLKSLHWLPINSRIQYKVALTIHDCIHARSPTYLQQLIHNNQTDRTTRQSNTLRLMQPRTHTIRLGERALSYFGPALWNTLPITLRTTTNRNHFRTSLKTYLFNL